MAILTFNGKELVAEAAAIARRDEEKAIVALQRAMTVQTAG